CISTNGHVAGRSLFLVRGHRTDSTAVRIKPRPAVVSLLCSGAVADDVIAEFVIFDALSARRGKCFWVIVFFNMVILLIALIRIFIAGFVALGVVGIVPTSCLLTALLVRSIRELGSDGLAS